MQPPLDARQSTSGPAMVGLAMLGWGLGMVLGVMPHEDRIVGAGLAVFGAALLATRRGLPQMPRVPAWVFASAGSIMIAAVAVFQIRFGIALDVPKVALVGLGVVLVAGAAFVDRQVRLPLRGRPRVPVGSLLVGCVAALGTPLVMWGLQAAFKRLLGTTPVEAFVRIALLPPVAAILGLMGLQPVAHGQVISYSTRHGLLNVDVGAACSGVQAMALFGAVLAIYLFAERPEGRRLALWSFIGIAGVYVANLIRLTTLMLVGYAWGPATLEQAHAQAGWIFFVAWAVLFSRLARSPRRRRGRFLVGPATRTS